MSSSSPPAALREPQEVHQHSNARFTRKTTVVIVVAAGIACLTFLLGSRFWPFTRRLVTQDLTEASDSTVVIRGFRRTYFPSPGCVLEGVSFQHGQTGGPPLISIDRLIIRGSYLGILRHHVTRITAEGMRVVIPPFGSHQSFRTQPSNVVVDEIVANGATVEFLSRKTGGIALTFDIHEATLQNVGWNGPLRYRVKVHNPQPPGEIGAVGEFGVWRTDDAGQTPVSGEYTFDHADLSVYGGIGGMLASRGKFGGVLKQIDITGSTDVPDFDVTSGGHPVSLVTKFDAYVDAIHGDTFLRNVDAHWGRTRVAVQGIVAGAQGRSGKVAELNLTAPQGRIEDVLGLFVKGSRAPMSGALSFKARAEIPAGEEPFLKRVKVQAEFGIDEGSFSKPETQSNVNKLSAGARGESKDDPETVVSDLKGNAALDDGVARFSSLSFGVPGAAAQMQGSYGIISHKIDLHGTLRVDSKISQTTSGVKAVLLKAMDPVFKKKKKGEIVPVHIAGTYEHPTFGLDLGHQDGQKTGK